MPGGRGPHGGGGCSPQGGCSHHTEASEPGLHLSVEVAAARAAPGPGCAIFLMERPPWGVEGSRGGGFMPGGTAACPSRSVLLLVLCDRCHVGSVVWGPSAHGPGFPHGVHTHSVNSFLHQALL